MKLIDAHCHLASPHYHDVEGLIRRSRKAGIVGVIAVGSDLVSSRNVLELQEKYPDFVFAAAGIHPERASVSQKEVEAVCRLIEEEQSRLVAVGEIGLPYYSVGGGEVTEGLLEERKELLKQFLKVARKVKLPVVLHAPHSCANLALSLLQEVGIERAMFHWHKAPQEVTQAIVQHHYFISLTPELCYRERDQEIAKQVPLSNLLLETDGPWPFKGEFEGKETEPPFIVRAAQKVAEMKGVDLEEVGKSTFENSVRLFRLHQFFPETSRFQRS